MGEKWFRDILKTVDDRSLDKEREDLVSPPDPSAASLAFDRLT